MKKPIVGIITYPGQGTRTAYFQSFFGMLLLHCERLVVIAGNIPEIDNKSIRIFKMPFHESGSHSLFSRIAKYVLPQLIILPRLITISKNCDVIIFVELAELYTGLLFITKLFLTK